MMESSQTQGPFGNAAHELTRLLHIMARLRSPTGCPWDLNQDSLSLRPYLIEEAYEVLEAINADDPDWLCEELGDLLLQVVFHAQIHSESNAFNMGNVIRGIADKMERRHPHVFAGTRVECEDQLKKNWEAIKQREKLQQKTRRTQNPFPAELPALLKAQKLHASTRRQNRTEKQHCTEALPDDLKLAMDQLERYSTNELQKHIPSLLIRVTQLAEKHGINCEVSLQDLITEQLGSISSKV